MRELRRTIYDEISTDAFSPSTVPKKSNEVLLMGTSPNGHDSRQPIADQTSPGGVQHKVVDLGLSWGLLECHVSSRRE